MFGRKPELGFNKDKLGSVQQNSFTGKGTDMLKSNHQARMTELNGNKRTNEKLSYDVLRVKPSATNELTYS